MYNDNGAPIDPNQLVSGDGLVMKNYLLAAYPNLVNGVKESGLWAFGYNTNGQLGTNNLSAVSTPVQTVAGGISWKQVSTSGTFTMAIKTDGTLWVWGGNTYGQLGTNNITGYSSAVQTVSGGTNWRQVSTGGLGLTSAIKTDGTLWGWGRNLQGQLGDNTIVNKSSPVQTVAGGTNWQLVVNGGYHTAAIKTDSTLWVWGQNNYGQLGDNTIVNKSSPIQTVASGTNWKSSSAGWYHNIAIKTDGTLWSWGRNNYGQLGDTTTGNKSSPIQTVAGGTNWKSSSAGHYGSAGIKTDGTLWLWGRNNYGQLGTNDIVDYSSPVQTVSGGTNWKFVSVSGQATAGIKTDGTLWLWGGNFGTLGTNDIVDYSSPVQTVAGGNNWRQVSVGSFTTLAISDLAQL